MVCFTGKVAIVTGAASGIGAATVRRLADEGASVVVADIQDDRGTAVVRPITTRGGNAIYQHCDVASLDDWQTLADRTLEQFGQLDIVINNAYTLVKSPAHELAANAWDRQIDVCLKQVYLSVRACIPYMGAGGAIVNTSSVHALVGLRGHPAYAAAKGALCALTRQLAVEYGPAIRVNAVLPGAIMTPASAGMPAEAEAEFTRHIVARRLGTAEEVAAAICFLASDDSSYITGANLVVDGGWTITKE